MCTASLISMFNNPLLFFYCPRTESAWARDSDKRKYIKSVLTLLLFSQNTRIYTRSPKHAARRRIRYTYIP